MLKVQCSYRSEPVVSIFIQKLVLDPFSDGYRGGNSPEPNLGTGKAEDLRGSDGILFVRHMRVHG